MRHYAGYDTVADASAAYDELRKQATYGKVRDARMFEVAKAVRLPEEKPYVVTWHDWTD